MILLSLKLTKALVSDFEELAGCSFAMDVMTGKESVFIDLLRCMRI